MKKHVCMIVYSNYSTDMRVRREAETIASLPEFDVSVIGLREKDKPREYLLDRVNVQEVNLAKYRGKSSIRYLLSYCSFVFRAFLSCSKLFASHRLDVVHIHNMPNFLVLAALLPVIAKRKIILDIHDTMLETYASKFQGFSQTLMSGILKLEEQFCCKLANHIICVNEPQKNAIIRRNIPENKITISMNVPDPKRLEGWSDRTGRSHSADGFRIAYFGTMSKRLGIDLALKAVASLKDRIPGLQLYLLGDGDDLDEFISLSQRLGIMKHTYFSGKMLPFDQLLDVLETVELVIVPNRRNSATELMLPVKLLECVGLGIPAVVPRLKAIEHYFDKDMVFFFEPDEIESLADAILSAYNHEEERNRRVERARTLLERYGWDTHKYNLIGLYGS